MKYALFFLSLFTASIATADDEVFLLTKSLDFASENGSKKVLTLRPKNQPTLIRKISESNGVMKVEVFQENGKPVSKKLSISTKWLARGTTSQGLDKFIVDPNPIVQNINPDCEEEKTPVVPATESCKVLSSGDQDIEKHMECFASIQERLEFNNPTTSYKSLSKLYTLSPEEQKFMACILTMYGEARGLDPVEQQMAAVMKVVENRTKYAQNEYSDANELDVVLQNSQFSMFNPRDPNWKKAITADPAEMRDAIRVFASKTTNMCTAPDNVYHYATTQLCRSSNRPNWAKSSRKIDMEFSDLDSILSGHTFFYDIAWSFNPSNRYKEYASQNGLIK